MYILNHGDCMTVSPWALTWDDEHSEIAVDVNVSSQFFGWIFGLGNGVKVTGPSEVVEEMKSFAEEFLSILQTLHNRWRNVRRIKQCWRNWNSKLVDSFQDIRR